MSHQHEKNSVCEKNRKEVQNSRERGQSPVLSDPAQLFDNQTYWPCLLHCPIVCADYPRGMIPDKAVAPAKAIKVILWYEEHGGSTHKIVDSLISTWPFYYVTGDSNQGTLESLALGGSPRVDVCFQSLNCWAVESGSEVVKVATGISSTGASGLEMDAWYPQKHGEMAKIIWSSMLPLSKIPEIFTWLWALARWCWYGVGAHVCVSCGNHTGHLSDCLLTVIQSYRRLVQNDP